MQRSMIGLISPADIISMINAGFGFFAVLFLLTNSINTLFAIRLSFTCILLALLADGLDGIIARRISNKGVLGEYFEAMADMTSLGIAPAFFLFIFFQNKGFFDSEIKYIFLIGLLLLFICCIIIRLASFHHLKTENHFIGLPASAATILIITIAFLDYPDYLILSLIFLTSLMMISNIHFPKPIIQMNAVAALIIILTALFEKQFFGLFPILLLIIIIFYVIIGPIFLKIKDY